MLSLMRIECHAAARADPLLAFPVKLLGDLEGVRVDLDDRIHPGSCLVDLLNARQVLSVTEREVYVQLRMPCGGRQRDLVEFKIVVEILAGIADACDGSATRAKLSAG